MLSYPLLQANGQIDDGDIGGGDTERHSGEFSVETGNDLADGLGSPGGRRDDVLGGGASASPVLVARSVDRLLGCRVGVDGGHQPLDDSEVVVDDLGEGGKTVGGA